MKKSQRMVYFDRQIGFSTQENFRNGKTNGQFITFYVYGPSATS